MKPFQLVTLLCALSAVALTACSPKVQNRGYVRDIEIEKQIKAGRDTQEDVRSLLGSPSARSNFGRETWYYITSRKEAVAFFAPDVVEQDVTRIVFDETGMVSEVDLFDKESSQDIDISNRETPTEGHEFGFMEQLLGNIGRFNSPADSNGPGRRDR